MKSGRIKWFNDSQNYGYIVLNDGSEVYFHCTGLSPSHGIGNLTPGMDVTFDLIETRTGPEANNIELLG